MNERENRPSLADRAGIVIFMVIGAAIVALTAIGSIRRIIEIAGGGPVELLAQFMAAPATIQLGTNGGTIDVQVETAGTTVAALPDSAVGLAILEPVVTLLTVTVVIVCLTILAGRILRGSVFGRLQTRCAIAAGLTGIVGFALAPVFGNLAAHTALASATGEGTEFAILAVTPVPFLVAGFVISIVITAFAVGERMQRDQEGLV